MKKRKVRIGIALMLGVTVAGCALINSGIVPNVLATSGSGTNWEFNQGEGNDAGSGATQVNCDNAADAIQTLCPDGNGSGRGGVSWHFYKICDPTEGGYNLDEREDDGRYACHGPSTPSGSNVFGATDVNVEDIYQTCSKENGYGWYVVYGWEGMGNWNQPNGQRWDDTMPGSVLLGPVNYGTGDIVTGAQYNNFGAIGSSLQLVESGNHNNSHLTQGAAEELFCLNYMKKTGNYDPSTCHFSTSSGDDGMVGKGYFCVSISDGHTLTINFKGMQKEKKDCYGRTTQQEGEVLIDQIKVQDNGIDDRNPLDGKIHTYSTMLDDVVNQGWKISDRVAEDNPDDDLVVNWQYWDADVTDGDKTYTIWFEEDDGEGEEGEGGSSENESGEEGDEEENLDPEQQQCDIDCMAWVPDSYLASNDLEGETTVAMGLINDSLTNANNEWHHMTSANTKIATGPIWAKPTDNITWKYCYYPGAQATANSEVTKDNEDPHPNFDNALNNITFQEYSDWGDSSYHVWTEGLKGEADVDETYTVGKGVVQVSWGTMPNGGLFNNEGWYGIKPRLQPPYPPEDGNLLDPGTTKTGYIQALDSDVTWAKRNDEGNHSWVCGYSIVPIYCHHTNHFWRNDRQHRQNDGWQKDNSMVKVPYNFKNDAQAVIQNNDPLYAGETVTLSKSNAHIGTRDNEETQGDYATQVPNARARVVAFLAAPGVKGQDLLKDVSKSDDWGNDVGDGYYIWNSQNDVCGENGVYNAKFNVCEFLESNEGTFNPKGSMVTTGVKDSYPILKDGTTYNVFDEAAGNQYCVSAAIYPYAVKNNSDDRDGDGLPDKDHDMEGTDYAWLITEPDCRTIAKKPTFQVWGAGMYAIGDVTSNVSYKNNILADVRNVRSGQGGFKPWTPLYGGVGTETFFSSWVESNLTLEGTSSTMASGAATGHNQSEGGYTGPSPWYKDNGVDVGLGNPGGLAGNLANNYCNRSPLSISNYDCNKSVGGFNETEYREDLRTEMDALHDRLVADYNNCSGENGPAPALCSLYEFHTDAAVPATNLEQGKTVVYLADGDINITGDVKYQLFGYKTIQQIPKMVIFAKNVNIGCNVQRLDALIVAEDNVTTCGTSAPVQSPALEQDNSLQLVVNGAIVSGTLTLNRSYGAATGADSITPAELFNYDSSLYLWSYRNAEAATSGQMTETSSKELAPRY